MKNRLFILLSVLCVTLVSCSTARITYESGMQQDKNVCGILLDKNVRYIHLLQIDGNNVNPFTSVRDLIVFKPGKRMINFIYADGDNLARPIYVTYDFAGNMLYGVKYQIVEDGSPELNQEYVKMLSRAGLFSNQSRYVKVSLYEMKDMSLTEAIAEYSKKEPSTKETGATKGEESGK